MIRKNGRPSQIQITGVLHEVRWKLVLGIEGGAQGNCYTPFTSIYSVSSLPNIYPLSIPVYSPFWLL
ncbi:hypothetical protein WH47_01300 [Habropoda laboriosa]|uniref:Uncharacterized protein n=1 Tax=Habropoda laboriosa TaxID=597456 RepID=A0A0L7QZD8_9HYME|nr:hypothetical protein WH47_01300 [Habropoda laboriosa]